MKSGKSHLVHRRTWFKQAGALAAAVTWVPVVQAQPGTGKVVKIVVPTAPGGSVDSSARLLADALNKVQNERFIVENRAGAGGAIGVQSVVKSAPDGQTLVLGIAATISVQTAVNPNLQYNPLKDLAPIAVFAQGGLVVAVAANSPCRTIKDLIPLVKERQELTFGTGGQGTFGHLTGEVLKSELGVPMRHIPYRGSAPAVTDLIGGQLDFCVVDAFSMAPHVQAGKARILATASPVRHPTFPQVPTLSESGVPFNQGTWLGLFAPAEVNQEVVKNLSKTIETLSASADFRKHLAQLGFIPMYLGPQETQKLVSADIDAWKRIAKSANVKVE
ncbi:Bug family tripartite tricarboxylate transporter substrate binding protein [Ottowia thiooxydans]|uniref:Tripartite-type tricarboxylate transporter receptor subunit TctC n=1 Tax=Ottowia thiooxydans TaxID=219182 RepID=A0ABV2Q2B5_9BURK